MISSRWPRPIGTMESIALRPVCTGCATDWRAITPGATFSITSVSLALIAPLPSIGWTSDVNTPADRRAARVPHPAEELGTDRHGKDLAGALDGVALGDVRVFAENHRADR